jgi:hypothetical protein
VNLKSLQWNGEYRLKYASPTYYFVHTMWKQGKVVPPSFIGQRKATKFIREEQKKILRSDKIHDVILSYTQSRKETRSEAEDNSEEEEGKKRISSLTRNKKMKNQKRKREKKFLEQSLRPKTILC